VTAAIWGMPIVSVNAMRQAFFRDAKANYNDVVFYGDPGRLPMGGKAQDEAVLTLGIVPK
jgi:hypothetical protein